MKFLVPFTINASTPEVLEATKQRNRLLFTLFLETVGKFHHITLCTDKQSHEYLGDYQGIEVKYWDTSEFEFIDDFKVTLLSFLEEDEYIIDFDIFSEREITVEKGRDVVLDKFEKKSTFEMYTKYINLIPFAHIKEYFLSIKGYDRMPNIGIFKINNKELLQEYTKRYFEYRNDFIELSKNHNFKYKIYSALFSQHILNDVITEMGIEPYMCSDNVKNSYTHLNGGIKYKLSEQELRRRLSKKTLM